MEMYVLYISLHCNTAKAFIDCQGSESIEDLRPFLIFIHIFSNLNKMLSNFKE